MKRLIVVGIYILFAATLSYTIFSAIRIARSGEPDFGIFYHAARDVLIHVSPYTDTSLFTAFNYPLATTLFFIPLALLPLQVAQAIATFGTLISVCIIVALCFVLLKKSFSPTLYILGITLILLSFPTKFTIGMGQTNLLAYAMLLGGFALVKKTKTSAILLSAAFLLKPILAVTLLVLLFEKKWSVFYITCILLVGIVSLFPLVVSQPAANMIFVQQLLLQSTAGREVYYNQGLLGFISRLTTNLASRQIFFISTAIPLLGFSLWKMAKKSLTDNLSLILTLLVLLDPLSWQHHFVFLIFPFFFLFATIKKKHHILFYSLLILSYILVSWNIKTPQAFTDFPFIFLLSTQLYGAAILLYMQLFLM